MKKDLQKLWDYIRGKKKLDKIARSQIKFRELYPAYEIGLHTYGVPIVYEWGEGKSLRIGNYCSIARNVQIFLGGEHRTDWVSSYPFPAFFSEAKHIKDYNLSRGDVTIGSDVWLCTGCMILSGVAIGHGAVIGAGAVVTRDVEPYAVMAGNPAKLVRYRFDESTRKQLLEAAWWDWPEKEIRQVIDMLCSGDIDRFLVYAQSRPLEKLG